MKTFVLFISFVSAVTFASIGIEEKNNLVLLAGLLFVVITTILVFSMCKDDLLTVKK